jgi:hypothetical protein
MTMDQLVLLGLGAAVPFALFIAFKGVTGVGRAVADFTGRIKAEVNLFRGLPAQVAALAETSTVAVAPVPIALPVTVLPAAPPSVVAAALNPLLQP